MLLKSADDKTKRVRLLEDLQKSNQLGNPPEKPVGREVEVFEGEFLHEEVKVYRQPDHGCAQAGGGRLVSAFIANHVGSKEGKRAVIPPLRAAA